MATCFETWTVKSSENRGNVSILHILLRETSSAPKTLCVLGNHYLFFMIVSLQTNFTNVIGLLKGERFGQMTDRILGVGAHYDTVPTTPG